MAKQRYKVQVYAQDVMVKEVVTSHPGRFLMGIVPETRGEGRHDLTWFITRARELHGLDVWMERIEEAVVEASG